MRESLGAAADEIFTRLLVFSVRLSAGKAEETWIFEADHRMRFLGIDTGYGIDFVLSEYGA